MEQTLAIKGRGRVSREGITKMQEEVNREAMTVRRVRSGALIATNVLVSPLVLLPLLHAVSVVFMPPGELFTMEMNLVPRQSTLDNFRQALAKIPLVRFVCNPSIAAGLTIVGQIISCSPAAFSFPLLEFKGKNVFFMPVMIIMMILGEAIIISNYLTVSQWNWLDFHQVPIVPYLTLAMGIFLFRQSYKLFPISLYKPVKVDGRGNLRFIFCTLFPLIKSVTGAMAVYTFINAWNMYTWPLLATGSNEMRTAQIGTNTLNSVDIQSITLMITGMVMIILPSTSISILGQKQLIRGMPSGAVKGQTHPEKFMELSEVRINYKRRNNNYEKEINRLCCSPTGSIHAGRVRRASGGHGCYH